MFWFSMICTALGCCTLLLVLSVLNGFQSHLWNKYQEVLPQYQIVTEPKSIDAIHTLLTEQYNIKDATKSLEIQGIIRHQEQSHLVKIVGVADTDYFLNNIQPWRGSRDLQPKGIAMSTSLANMLGVTLNSTLQVQLPKLNYTILGIKPRTTELTVKGLFYSGSDFDTTEAFVDLATLEKLWQSSANRIRIAHPVAAIEQLQQDLPQQARLEPWYQSKQALFAAMRFEKQVMKAMLLIVILIATINIASGLLLFIAEKKRDIAILKTIGASHRLIAVVYFILGLIMATIGIVFGCLMGYLVANNLTAIVTWVGAVFGFQLFDPQTFYITHLPSQWLWSDCIQVILFSYVLTLICITIPIKYAYQSTTIEALTR